MALKDFIFNEKARYLELFLILHNNHAAPKISPALLNIEAIRADFLILSQK